MKRLIPFFVTVGLFLVTFTATAAAQSATLPDDSSLFDLLRPVYEAVLGGNWWLAASLSLVVAVAAFKRYAPGKAREWSHTDVGGSLLVLLMAFGGALASALGGAPMSLGLAWTALQVAVGASGGYSLAKKLVAPLLAKAAEKAPNWLKGPLQLVLWIFDKKPAVVAEAEQAGKDAVEAKPAEGAESVTGEPKDFS